MVDRESDGAARGSTGTFAQPGESGVDDADPDRVAQFFDAVAYAAATTVVFGVFSGVVTLAVGGRFAPGVKFGLFVFGWVAFGYGTLLLWPEAAWKDDDDEGRSVSLFDRAGGPPDTGFQRFVQRLPPARFRQIPHRQRLSTGSRVLFAAVGMMVTSIVLEQFFGIGP
ncbi:hypothetical protein HALDL1_16430 [Halobacterium sp. DL1]|jgi:hypothetical protein|nr:hypothetical protein HALDL1_16430 [Halobacterium sp. DL1]